MRTPFALAGLVLISQQAQAMDWSDITEMVMNFDYSAVDQFMSDNDIYDHPVYKFMKTNRHHTTERNKASQRRIQPLTTQQRIQYNDSHHRLMARREKLGLAQVGTGNPNVGQNYDALDNTKGLILNTLKGMSYG